MPLAAREQGDDDLGVRVEKPFEGREQQYKRVPRRRPSMVVSDLGQRSRTSRAKCARCRLANTQAASAPNGWGLDPRTTSGTPSPALHPLIAALKLNTTIDAALRPPLVAARGAGMTTWAVPPSVNESALTATGTVPADQ